MKKYHTKLYHWHVWLSSISTENKTAVAFSKKFTKKSTVVFFEAIKNSTADKVQMRRTYDITTGRMLTGRLPVSVYTGTDSHEIVKWYKVTLFFVFWEGSITSHSYPGFMIHAGPWPHPLPREYPGYRNSIYAWTSLIVSNLTFILIPLLFHSRGLS